MKSSLFGKKKTGSGGDTFSKYIKQQRLNKEPFQNKEKTCGFNHTYVADDRFLSLRKPENEQRVALY